jgi:hypothetical protein
MSRRLIIGAIAWSVLAGTAFADERELTVAGDETRCIRIRKAVDRHDVNSEPQDVVKARFDTNLNRLCVEGRQRGNATVRFSGSYRRIEVGRDLRENSRSFEETVQVRVLPPRADVKRASDVYEFDPGKSRRFQLGIFMTPEFSRRDDEKEKWRGVRILEKDPGIVEAKRINDGQRVFLQVSGLSRGETTLRLIGQRKVRNDWQDVVRDVRVRVR